MRKINNVAVFLFAALLFETSADLRAQEQPFYQGKTVKIIVGFTSGGFYDGRGCWRASYPNTCREIRK